MIESTIKSVATFDSTGTQINDLKKVNFFYGCNGSGKTTIANFLHDNSDSKFGNCSLKWRNGLTLSTLVYNKEFRERNFGKGKIAGVFTLGQATKEEREVIVTKSDELKALKEEGVKKRESLNTQIALKESLEKEFAYACWKNVFKKYEREFKEAFVGSMKSGEAFKTRMLKEFHHNVSTLRTVDYLKENADVIFGEVPQIAQLLTTINYERILALENLPIWKKVIVGKADVDIAKLIQKLNINDWVNQGRNYLQVEDNTCPFCQQQTIKAEFKNQLEVFFDETYISDINLLKELKQEYIMLTQNLINELSLIEAAQKGNKDTKLNIDKFSAYLKTLESQIVANREFLKNKSKEPSRSIELVSLTEQLGLIEELIILANKEVQKHNAIVDNYIEEKDSLIQAIWKFMIVEYKTEIENFEAGRSGLETGITAIQAQLEGKAKAYKALEDEIKRLNKNVTSIQPTIDEINRLLKSYGFINFKIVPTAEKGYYQIQREDGSVAENTLSEGEVTFITFLYYLQLAKGGLSQENVNDERILVIDDPISSLDSNVLFIVSTLVKEIIKEVKGEIGHIRQVIVLTHNIYFHKEVSFEGLNRKGEKSLFWILRKNNKLSTIHPYAEANPIQSSYDLLWREVREWKSNSGITIQNALRRILEHYFSILGSKRDEVLINKFPKQEEKEICRSLLSWIHEGSHTLPDDLFIEDPESTIVKYLDVFKDIFTHTGNVGHYNMMMKIEVE